METSREVRMYCPEVYETETLQVFSPICCVQRMKSTGTCSDGCCDDWRCEVCGKKVRTEAPD